MGRIIITIFLFLHLLTFPFPLALLVNAVAFIGRSEVTTGTIERMEYRGGRAELWVPVFSFTASSGEVHSGRGATDGGDPAPGKEVRVRYDPANPSSAKLDTFSELLLAPVLANGLWLALLVFYLLLGRRLPRLRGRASTR